MRGENGVWPSTHPQSVWQGVNPFEIVALIELESLQCCRSVAVDPSLSICSARLTAGCQLIEDTRQESVSAIRTLFRPGSL